MNKYCGISDILRLEEAMRKNGAMGSELNDVYRHHNNAVDYFCDVSEKKSLSSNNIMLYVDKYLLRIKSA